MKKLLFALGILLVIGTAYCAITGGGGGGGTSDHSALSNLDYASSGHTGFASSAQLATFETTAAMNTALSTFDTVSARNTALGTFELSSHASSTYAPISALSTFELRANKNAANGYASLDALAKVPTAETYGGSTAGLVPYTGATSAVNLGAQNITTTGIATADTNSVTTRILLQKGAVISRVASNAAGSALSVGQVVIFGTADSTGQSVTTSLITADALVFGVVVQAGNAGADVNVRVGGYCGTVNVNGDTAIAIGDPLCVGGMTAGVAQKGSYGVGSIFGIALQAYSGHDSSGQIKCWIF
jgi:hypothetical protein